MYSIKFLLKSINYSKFVVKNTVEKNTADTIAFKSKYKYLVLIFCVFYMSNVILQ